MWIMCCVYTFLKGKGKNLLKIPGQWPSLNLTNYLCRPDSFSSGNSDKRARSVGRDPSRHCASPVQGCTGELLCTQLLVAVLGSVLIVVSKLGLGQEGAEFHRLLGGTLEVAGQERLLDMQEKDMPTKQCKNEVMLGADLISS